MKIVFDRSFDKSLDKIQDKILKKRIEDAIFLIVRSSSIEAVPNVKK